MLDATSVSHSYYPYLLAIAGLPPRDRQASRPFVVANDIPGNGPFSGYEDLYSVFRNSGALGDEYSYPQRVRLTHQSS